MDISAMKSVGEDGVKRRKRRKKRSKKQAVENNGADEMNGLEASGDKGDYRVGSHYLEKDLIVTDLTVSEQGSNLNIAAKDGVKRSKRRNRRSKKQAVENNGAVIRGQMSGFEASGDKGDCSVGSHNLEKDLIVTEQGENMNINAHDGVKRSNRRKKRSKKQAVEKNGVEDRGQMNGLEASGQKGDFSVDSSNQEKDLIVTELTVSEQGENPNINAKDGVKRSRRRSKKQVLEKTGAGIRAQTNGLEILDDKGDCRVDTHNLGKDLVMPELTVNVQGENLNMNANSIQDLSKENTSSRKQKRRKRNKKANMKDEVQSIHLAQMDAVFTDLVEGNMTSVRESKQRGAKIAKIGVDVQSLGQTEMDTCSTKDLTEGNMTVKGKKKGVSKVKIQEEVKKISQMKKDASSTKIINKGDVTDKRIWEDESVKEPSSVELQSVGKHKTVAELTKTCTEGDMMGKRKRKRKQKAKLTDKVKSIDQNQTDKEPIDNHAERIVTSKCQRKREKKSNIEQNEMDIGSVENINGENATLHEKSITKAITIDEAKDTHQNKMDKLSVENLSEGVVMSSSRKRRIRRKKVSIKKKAENRSKWETASDFHLSDENCLALRTQPLELERNCCPGDSVHICDPNIFAGHNAEFKTEISGSNKIILDLGNGSAEQESDFSGRNMEDADQLYTKMLPITSIRRKLLILDINGLLADVVLPAPEHCRADARIFGRAIFRRPYCNDFMQFCFQNFDVGIWSSRNKNLVHKIANFLLGDLKEKLLFCWDMEYCTQTGYKTLENRHKPLVCKELRKIWENDDPNLRWRTGDYTASNTLLIDDSPYKALLNPLHTAIFPHSYEYTTKHDNSLGPAGDLRIYLEGLVKSESVQKYVAEHPFGQEAINEQNDSWDFYSTVLNRQSKGLEIKCDVQLVV